MKTCKNCKAKDERGRRRHKGGCNWLDWMAKDDKCPHCGGPLTHLELTPLGKLLDEMG